MDLALVGSTGVSFSFGEGISGDEQELMSRMNKPLARVEFVDFWLGIVSKRVEKRLNLVIMTEFD